MSKHMKIANFHSDLLWYLSVDDSRSAADPESRTSIPLLLEGGVRLETLAVYEKTQKHSSQKGEKQFQIFRSLPEKYLSLWNKKIEFKLAMKMHRHFVMKKNPSIKEWKDWSDGFRR